MSRHELADGVILERPSRPAVSPAPLSVLVLAVAATAVHAAAWVANAFRPRGPGVPIWQASQYWVDYSDGFIRRGLPGQVLDVVAGGPPEAVTVTVTVALLLVGAVCGYAILAWLTYTAKGVAVAAVVLVAPFTVTLAAQDLGRYDVIGVIALASIVLASRVAKPLPLVVVAVVGSLVAVAGEEFLALFVIPVAYLATATVIGRKAALVGQVPALTLAVVSVTFRPAPSALLAAASRGHGARPDIPADGHSTAVAALAQTTTTAIAHLGALAWWTLPLFTGAFAVCYFAAAWLVNMERVWRYFYAGAAVALSLIGIDYRRWWALAFVALVATWIVRGDRRCSAERSPLAVVVVLSVLLAGQLLPVSASSLDPGAATHLVIPSGN